MTKRTKDITVIMCFMMITVGFMLINIIIPDAEYSYSERRKLAHAPKVSWKSLISGSVFNDLEDYFPDQFVFRDYFRSLKAYAAYNLFQLKDNNGIYIISGNINKIEYPLKEKSVLTAAEKINQVYKKYLQNHKVYYAVIPDKNYFLASPNGYLSMDYDKMLEILKENITGMTYIDLFEVLNIDDYYLTDIHWKQENIIDVAGHILKELGNDLALDEKQFIRNEVHPFCGSFYGQAAVMVQPDTMVYLTNPVTDNAKVYDYQSKTNMEVYQLDKLKGIDPYDIFLSGPKPLFSVTNTQCTGGKELILFRDSFGSSIAPLLLQSYSKITLVDLRYISTDLLGDFLDFSNKSDVLFLYSTQVINNSEMLK